MQTNAQTQPVFIPADSSEPNFDALQGIISDGQAIFGAVLDSIKSGIQPFSNPKRIETTGNAVFEIIKRAFVDESRQKEAQRFVAASLLYERGPELLKEYEPENGIHQIQKNFGRMIAALTSEDDPYSDFDFFIKDMSYTYGEIIPCGTQGIALKATASAKSMASPAALKAYGYNPFKLAGPLLKLGKSWARTHTDSRILNNFHEQGWDDAYFRIAKLIEPRREIFGIVATAWFFDPKILEISPKLGYLQLRTTERGAFLFNHGPGEQHTAWATERSTTRRKLYEEGKYQPLCYSMTWPRDALIAWAKSVE